MTTSPIPPLPPLDHLRPLPGGFGPKPYKGLIREFVRFSEMDLSCILLSPALNAIVDKTLKQFIFSRADFQVCWATFICAAIYWCHFKIGPRIYWSVGRERILPAVKGPVLEGASCVGICLALTLDTERPPRVYMALPRYTEHCPKGPEISSSPR